MVMEKLVDSPALESGVERRVGSSPTNHKYNNYYLL